MYPLNIIISLQRRIHGHLTPPPFATPLKFIAIPPIWYASPLQKGARIEQVSLTEWRFSFIPEAGDIATVNGKCFLFFQKGLSGRPANFAEMRDHTSSRWNHDDQIPLWNFLYVLKRNSAAKILNRFHVNVTEHLFSNRSQMRSKCGKNRKRGREKMLLMFSTHFDVFCHLLLNRPTCNLFAS